VNQLYPTGLGEPEVIGKQALFQPPTKGRSQMVSQSDKVGAVKPERRFRMTMEITKSALEIIQQAQSKHRLLTGQVLPKWRIINDALSLYGRQKEGKYEHSNQ
jgi:hypothetical protein